VFACCRLAGYLLGAVVPLQQATGLRSLTIEGMADSYSLQYLPLLTQLTELCIRRLPEAKVGLVVGTKAPLADMRHLRMMSLGVGDRFPFQLCQDNDIDQASLPLVLPPHLTQLEVCVPQCEPGMFWRHIAACRQLLNLTVHHEFVVAAADHTSWMLYCLADGLPHLQHLTIVGDGHAAEEILQEVLDLLAGTQEAQQQQEEQGWDWEDLAAPGLGTTRAFEWVVVPPPNMGRLTSLQTLHFTFCSRLRCCGPHHWHALAGCRSLQQLHWAEAWAVPPAGVKLPGVTDLQIGVFPSSDTLAVLGAFPALQQLELELHQVSPQQVKYNAGQRLHAATHLHPF
jgi:hypothetical protein